MANLKQLRSRIDNVKGTKRITSAMKMVAAAKLRRAQQNAEKTRPYSSHMRKLIGALSQEYQTEDGFLESGPPLLVGKKNNTNPLYIVVSSDRGLCGGFNAGLVKFVHQQRKKLQSEGKDMSLIMLGRKIVGAIGYTDSTFEVHEDVSKAVVNYNFSNSLSERVIDYFNSDDFGECFLVYNRFASVLVQELTVQKLIPFVRNNVEESTKEFMNFEFEPNKETVLEELLPRNIAVQIYGSILESFAAEQAARMTAMDNATRNANDMIKHLTLTYNRQRQANITRELIEIISGAEAL